MSCLEQDWYLGVCVSAYVCVCAGEGAAPVILSVNCCVSVDSSPPLVSWGFGCIQVSLPEHTQALAFPGSCLWSWIPVYLQPVSQHQGCSSWQTHCCGLCFPFQVLTISFSFFHWATKNQQKIIDCSVHKKNTSEGQSPQLCLKFPRVSRMTSETCLVCKVHTVWKSIIQIFSGMGLHNTNSWKEHFFFHGSPWNRGMFFLSSFQCKSAAITSTSVFCLLFLLRVTR